MYPVLFEISESIKIYAFGAFIVLAFLVSSIYVQRRATKTLGLDGERVMNLCFILLFVGLAGARLLYVFINYSDFASTPMSLFYVWNGGLVYYGGLIACLLYLAWSLPRRTSWKGWALLDIMALGASLAIFVGRFASFLGGENYGKPAEGLPWAVKFPPHEFTQVPNRLIGVELHPTQLYHGLHGLILFVLLALFMRARPKTGRTAGLFLMLYAIGRSIVEIWRGDDAARGMVIDGFMSTSQLISIPIFFLGLTIFLMRKHADEEVVRMGEVFGEE